MNARQRGEESDKQEQHTNCQISRRQRGVGCIRQSITTRFPPTSCPLSASINAAMQSSVQTNNEAAGGPLEAFRREVRAQQVRTAAAVAARPLLLLRKPHGRGCSLSPCLKHKPACFLSFPFYPPCPPLPCCFLHSQCTPQPHTTQLRPLTLAVCAAETALAHHSMLPCAAVRSWHRNTACLPDAQASPAASARPGIRVAAREYPL